MSAVDQLAPGEEFGEFRIERELGRGGMGVVYLAEQVSLGRKVALKIISPELAGDEQFSRRFEREARLAASLDHPNVVPVYSTGKVEGLLYLSMRYVRGTDLKRLVAGGSLAPAYAARVIEQLAAALDTAHAEGLVHRDVKPANVLVSGEGDAAHFYLSDFGLTKEAVAQTSGGLTATGAMVGTVDYAAPEQIEGRSIDARTDVYALGCVLYEMLSGQVPYPGTSAQKIWGHMDKPVPALTAKGAGSAELDSVIARAMAKSPDDRYPSAGDLARAARAALEGAPMLAPERSVATGEAAPGVTAAASTQGIGAPPAAGAEERPTEPIGEPAAASAATEAVPGPPPMPPQRPKRRPLLVGAAVVVVLAAGIAAGILAISLLGSDEAEPPVGAGAGGNGAQARGAEEGLRFERFRPRALDYVVQVPTGNGWGRPIESEPTLGRLYRVRVNGPAGVILLIDHTPGEQPRFGGAYDSSQTVSHPRFDTATEYVFSQSELIPECNGGPCVDYLVNDDRGGGFGVLAGGGEDFELAQRVAQRTMRSIRFADE